MIDVIARCMSEYGGPVADWLDTPLPLIAALAVKATEMQAERARAAHYGILAASGRAIADGAYRDWLNALDTSIRGRAAVPTSLNAARNAAARLGLV